MLEQILIDTKAVHVNTKELFTWTSGKKSPIYCNNRLLISFPKYRSQITDLFIEKINSHFPNTELIAGTSTAGIPWAAFIAQKMNLPMIYIRSTAKGHGLKSAIEGKAIPGQKTIIIEDLISTGKSSLEAYDHAKNAELDVLSILSLFTYGLESATNTFKQKQVNTLSMANFNSLLLYLKESNQVDENDLRILNQWHSGKLY